MLSIYKDTSSDDAIRTSKKFMNADSDKRFVFGRNEYAESLASNYEIAGFIDDFTNDLEFLGKPIYKTANIPQDSIIVSSVMVKPLSVRNLLTKENLCHIDYFAFSKYSERDLMPVKFWHAFNNDFKSNKNDYDRIHDLLFDNESKDIFEKLINFRLSANLSYMEGFFGNQKFQYFEDFLMLKDNEIFYDVGCFDGYTTLKFIKMCPKYKSVFIFKPDSRNMEVIKDRLSSEKNIHYVEKGLSNKKENVKFSSAGSASKISSEGELKIEVDRLDDLLDEKVSFIKMDIEGGERAAIEGSKQTILNHHPRLAICVYHRGDDFRKIPQQILSIRDDYRIYLRHYAEGVTETVMFFIPK